MKRQPAIIGSHFFEIDACDSTNRTLQEWLKTHPLPEGTVLRTHQQNAGRGQGTNTWISEPGQNLTFSCVLFPENLNLSHAFILNMAITLGIYDYLTGFFHDHVKIKWPNDLLVNQKKIAGILFANTIRDQKVTQSVIGIGINMNQEKFHDLPNAVSLFVLLKQKKVLADELVRLLKCLDERYRLFREGKFEEIRVEFSRSLLGYHEPCNFFKEDVGFTASIMGVNTEGKLALHEGDTLNYYSHQEIKQSWG